MVVKGGKLQKSLAKVFIGLYCVKRPASRGSRMARVCLDNCTVCRGDRTHVGRFQHFRYNTFNICPITFLTNAMNEAWPSLPPDFFQNIR